MDANMGSPNSSAANAGAPATGRVTAAGAPKAACEAANAGVPAASRAGAAAGVAANRAAGIAPSAAGNRPKAAGAATNLAGGAVAVAGANRAVGTAPGCAGRKRKLRYGMVGGAESAFIGGVHRTAIAFSNDAELVAGCFSTDPARNAETGRVLSLDASRVYDGWQGMLAGENGLGAGDRPDFVSIVTPNSTHYGIARQCLLAGFHVFCEKPMCVTLAQAEELRDMASERGLLFGVNYSYTGYAMVKAAREMARGGRLGRIISVRGQYLQEWLIDQVSGASDTARLSAWRLDPGISGGTNCVGDIGTHLENIVAYVTGLSIRRLCARLDRHGQPLDMGGSLLLEYDNGATGAYSCSQVSIGHQNGLAFGIYGTDGSLQWHQQRPDDLLYCARGGAPQSLSRGGGYLKDISASSWSRIPAGHPEGLYEAFANIYRAFARDVAAVRDGLETGREDYPGAAEGVAGMRFIEAALESDANGSCWVDL